MKNDSADRDSRTEVDSTTILIPIRYPLTAQSTQTLEYANRLTDDYDSADLVVLHVNLLQHGEQAQTEEIIRAVTPILGTSGVTVNVHRGFIVEEIILEEAARTGAEIIVIGENQKPAWRRFLSRIVGNDPAVATFLQNNVDARIEVVG